MYRFRGNLSPELLKEAFSYGIYDKEYNPKGIVCVSEFKINTLGGKRLKRKSILEIIGFLIVSTSMS